MKSTFILFKIFLILSSALFFVSCGEEEEPENQNGNNESIVYVKTEKVKFDDFVDYIYLIGTAKADKQAYISSEEGGKIKSILKVKGSYVSKGETLIIMENDVLKANLEAAKAQYDMAENNFVRQEKIFNEKVTSELTYLNSKYERDVAKANYELIKARYERTFIKAPFAGIVDEKLQEIGENVVPGQPILSLVQANRIKVVAGVPESYIGDVKQGGKVKIEFEDLNLELDETISYVGNTISTSNRTFPIEIMINNSNRRIKPELNAQVMIERRNVKDAIVVPEEIVAKTDLGYVVYIIEDGVARMREVEVISRYNNQAAIRNGIEEGDELVIVGYQNLVDGEKVKVVN